jgi:hypothetical protein
MTTTPRLAFAATFLALLLSASAARAEHFEIQLTIISSGDKQTAFSDTNTPQRQQGVKPRPVVHAKAGEELTLQFFFTSNFPHDAIKNVTVRYFVVAEGKAGQDAVPPREHAITEGHFVLDFQPKTGKVGLRERFKVEKAGTYLVRVESENSDTDHEHFSALDLIVE